MLRRYTIHGLALLIIGAVALAACGGDNNGPGTATPPASETPTADPTAVPPTAEPGTRPSGIASVDAAIAAIEAGDFQAFAKLLLLEPEACEPPAQGAGGPPQCEAGEAPGTLVEVLPVFSCEGAWVREGALQQALNPMLETGGRLYGVYRTDEQLFDRQGAYAVIVDIRVPEGPMAADVLMTDEGVVGVNFGCGHTAAELVTAQGLTDVIVEGDQAGTPPNGTCVEGSSDEFCSLAEQLAVAAAAGDAGAFHRLVDDATPERIVCEGSGLPDRATFLCEGAEPSEVRLGFALAVHGSEGTYIAPDALKDMLANYITRGASLASTGCGVDGCDRALVAFATARDEPRAVYIALDGDGGAGYVLTGAGVSGDNADTILLGGQTFTVIGEAIFEAWTGE